VILSIPALRKRSANHSVSEVGHLTLPPGERGQRIGVPAGAEKLPDHFGVEHGTAARHAADGLDEVADVRHPVLQQVADSGG